MTAGARIIIKYGFLALLLIPIGWVCLSFIEPEVVLLQAKRIAGDRPYCIVIYDTTSTPMRYKRVTSRSELTFRNLSSHLMWGGSGNANGSAENYYALLPFENPGAKLNWSKTYLNFESDVNPYQTSILHTNFDNICAPIADFARTVH